MEAREGPWGGLDRKRTHVVAACNQARLNAHSYECLIRHQTNELTDEGGGVDGRKIVI